MSTDGLVLLCSGPVCVINFLRYTRWSACHPELPLNLFAETLTAGRGAVVDEIEKDCIKL